MVLSDCAGLRRTGLDCVGQNGVGLDWVWPSWAESDRIGLSCIDLQCVGSKRMAWDRLGLTERIGLYSVGLRWVGFEHVWLFYSLCCFGLSWSRH